jgi:pimeloyl-ACP methyl ester carboxylesterase
MTLSTEVSWQLDGITMYGTVTRPEGDGPFPGVVLVAGSGPTDREWTSPLLPGTNGSARLIAEALAAAGYASIRYDKRASGPHVSQNLPQMTGRISMQFHLDELAAAVGVFTDDPTVDARRLVGFGNSEGCLHVLHYATTTQRHPFTAIVLTGAPGRSIGQILVTQLSQQLAAMPEMIPLVEEAAARYAAGGSTAPDDRLPEPVRMVFLSFETPANLPFARELWTEDATASLPHVTVPALVLIGGKDIQIDEHADGEPLKRAAAGMANVTFAFPPDANHVLKHETHTRPEVLAGMGTPYNDDSAVLDSEAMAVILGWMARSVG